MGRYLIPENIDREKVTVFSILDEYALSAYEYPYQQDEHAIGFGYTYPEGSRSQLMTQLFGYRLAEIYEMESTMGKNSWGFHYCIFKSKIFPLDPRVLISSSPDIEEKLFEESGAEVIGYGFHSSAYHYHANQECLSVAHKICLANAREIADKRSLSLVEMMHPRLKSNLEIQSKYYSPVTLHPTLCTPIHAIEFNKALRNRINS
jgi:hypothetical protein